jgi:CheY-like chemotaxis protein
VLERLRDDPATAHILVVILTAEASPGRRQRLLAAGARAFLTKPVDVRDLMATIDELLEEHTPSF